MSDFVLPPIIIMCRKADGGLGIDAAQFHKFTPHQTGNKVDVRKSLENLEYDVLFQTLSNTLEEAYDDGDPNNVYNTAVALTELPVSPSKSLLAVIKILTAIRVRDARTEHDISCDGMQLYRPRKVGVKRPPQNTRPCPVCARLEREAGLFGRAYAQVKRTLRSLKSKAEEAGFGGGDSLFGDGS